MAPLPGMETLAARLSSFETVLPAPKRRGSNIKGQKSISWPHQSPSPEEVSLKLNQCPHMNTNSIYSSRKLVYTTILLLLAQITRHAFCVKANWPDGKRTTIPHWNIWNWQVIVVGPSSRMLVGRIMRYQRWKTLHTTGCLKHGRLPLALPGLMSISVVGCVKARKWQQPGGILPLLLSTRTL